MNAYDYDSSYDSDSYGGSPSVLAAARAKAAKAASAAAKHASAAAKTAGRVGGKAAAKAAKHAKAAAKSAHKHASAAAKSGAAAARKHAANAHQAMKDAKAHRDHVNALAKARKSISDKALLEAISGHSDEGQPAHNLQADEGAQKFLELSLQSEIPADKQTGGYYYY